MNRPGEDGMWDEEDGFYYDLLRLPDGSAHAAQGALDGGAAAAVRHDGHRAVAARARPASDGRALASGCARCRSLRRRSTPPARAIWAWPSAASSPWSTRSGCAASSPRCSTRTSS